MKEREEKSREQLFCSFMKCFGLCREAVLTSRILRGMVDRKVDMICCYCSQSRASPPPTPAPLQAVLFVAVLAACHEES